MELSLRGKLVLTLMLELGALSLIAESTIMAGAALCVAFVLGLDGAHLWWRAHGLKLSMTPTLEKEVILQGSATHVRCVLRANGDDAHPHIYLEPSKGLRLEEAESTEVHTDEGVELRYTLIGERRGVWALGRLVLVLEDGLRLFRWYKTWRLDDTVEVYVSMGGKRIRPESMGGIRRRRRRAVGVARRGRWTPETMDVRRFSIGDSLKWVDWKLTARAQRPMVKPPVSMPETQLVLVLDVSKSMEGVLLEAAIEACSIVYGVCTPNHIPLAMLAFNEGKPVQHIATGLGKQHELMISRELSHINGRKGVRSTYPLLTSHELGMLRRFVLSSAQHDPEVAYFLDKIQPFVESMRVWKDVDRLELYQAMMGLVRRGGLATKVMVITSLQMETTPLLECLRLARYNGFELMLAALSPRLAGRTDENELRIFKERLRLFSTIPDMKIIEIESRGELVQLSSIVE